MDRGTLSEMPRRKHPSVSACRGSCTRPPPMQGIPLGTSAARKQEGTVLAGTRGRLISRREAAKGRCFPAARRLGRCFPERRLGRCCPGAPTMTDGQRTMLPCGPASGTMLPQTPPETMFPQGCLKTLAGIPDVTGVCVPNNKLSHNKLPSGELFKVFTFPLRSAVDLKAPSALSGSATHRSPQMREMPCEKYLVPACVSVAISVAPFWL